MVSLNIFIVSEFCLNSLRFCLEKFMFLLNLSILLKLSKAWSALAVRMHILNHFANLLTTIRMTSTYATLAIQVMDVTELLNTVQLPSWLPFQSRLQKFSYSKFDFFLTALVHFSMLPIQSSIWIIMNKRTEIEGGRKTKCLFSFYISVLFPNLIDQAILNKCNAVKS